MGTLPPLVAGEGARFQVGEAGRGGELADERAAEAVDQLGVVFEGLAFEGGGEVVEEAEEDGAGIGGGADGGALVAVEIAAWLGEGGLEVEAAVIEAVDDDREAVLMDAAEEVAGKIDAFDLEVEAAGGEDVDEAEAEGV